MLESRWADPRICVQVKDKIDLDSGELRCPRCYGKDLVPSLPRGLGDWIMARFGYIPRHCRFCEKRFFVDAEVLRDMERAISAARCAAYEDSVGGRPPVPPRSRRRRA